MAQLGLERKMLLEMEMLIGRLQQNVNNTKSDSSEVPTAMKALRDRVSKTRGEYTADLVGFIGRYPDALPAQTFAFAPSGSVEEEAASQILLNQDVDQAWKQHAVGKNGHTEAVSAGRRTRPTRACCSVLKFRLVMCVSRMYSPYGDDPHCGLCFGADIHLLRVRGRQDRLLWIG